MQDDDNSNIDLKIQHTLRVCDDIKTIGSQLKLEESKLILAEITALLHDIARFEQYRQFKTFNDKDSFDHAQAGYEIIKNEKILTDLDDYSQEIVLKSVRYHNRMNLPKIKDNNIEFFVKLLRDADKLDIYKVVTDYYQLPKTKRNQTIELNLDNSDKITDTILDAALSGRDINYQDAIYLNDFKLLQAGWIFNINFSPTLSLIKERGYLNILRSVLPDNRKIDQLFNNIDSYIMNHRFDLSIHKI